MKILIFFVGDFIPMAQFVSTLVVRRLVVLQSLESLARAVFLLHLARLDDSLLDAFGEVLAHLDVLSKGRKDDRNHDRKVIKSLISLYSETSK